jgi:ABC-type branched-subunit amino acid transport system ATPase component
MNLLAVENVDAGYGRVQILEDVSVQLSHNETLAVLGPNGSGKSTLVKTVMGLTTLHRGRIAWNTKDIASLPVHARALLGFGYVPQTQNIFPTLSVLENLKLGAYVSPGTGAQDELERVLHLFPRLKERLRIRAGNLSGGERRILSLATVLMLRPQCLLLDEPTTDLAPAMIDVVFDKIREIIREYHVPVLLVEQNVPQALRVANRVCVLIRGRKTLERDTSAISEDELGELFLQG